MASDRKNHPDQVDEWLGRNAKGLGSERLAGLFERAFHELWSCAHQTLSEITLRAIFDRAFYTGAEKYPLLSSILVSEEGVSFDEFKGRMRGHTRDEIQEALRFTLIEVLAITGSLTDQVIIPALHTRLSRTTLKKRVTK